MSARMIDCRCGWCHKPMKVSAADCKRGWGLYCSKSCKASDQAKNMGVPEFGPDPQTDQSWDEHKVWSYR